MIPLSLSFRLVQDNDSFISLEDVLAEFCETVFLAIYMLITVALMELL
jgi:hypothetical protein